MSILTRCYVTAIVIRAALVPRRPCSTTPAGPDAGGAFSGCRTAPPESIPCCLADLGRAVGAEGRLALFFPGCLVFAAPALLFRLKREGYSNGRATVTTEGLLVEATR
ncbi:MAG TPA: hypothetical protein VF775_06220 [Geobacteraceae bacterium]